MASDTDSHKARQSTPEIFIKTIFCFETDQLPKPKTPVRLLACASHLRRVELGLEMVSLHCVNPAQALPVDFFVAMPLITYSFSYTHFTHTVCTVLYSTTFLLHRFIS